MSRAFNSFKYHLGTEPLKSYFKKYNVKIFGGDIEVNESMSIYNREINTEDFPLRFRHIIKYFRITRLGPILNLDYKELVQLPNFNYLTMCKVYMVLDKMIEGYQFENIPEKSKTPESTGTGSEIHLAYGDDNKKYFADLKYSSFFDALEAELEKLPVEAKDKLDFYLIDGLTLDEIGKKSNVTKERTRQILKETIRTISFPLRPYKALIQQDLLQMIIRNPKLIESDYFANKKLDALFLTGLVTRMYPDLPFEKNRLNLKNQFVFQRHEQIIKAITSILERSEPVETGKFIKQLSRRLPDKIMLSLTVLLSWDLILKTVDKDRSYISFTPKYMTNQKMRKLFNSN